MPLVSKTFSEIITFTRASSATYFDSAGLLTSATTNTPRLDYNPATLAAQGLLIEEQRVNLLTYSNYFDNAAWTKSNATVNANAITSITGNVEADKLVENTAASTTHQISRGASKTAVATTYTASIFLKAAERSFSTIALTDAGGFIVAGFNLSNGACQINGTSGFTGGSVSTTLISNGWYRVVLTGTSTADVAINFIVRTATSIGVDSYTGDGTSGIYLYGAQLEAGAFATSYAPSVNTFTSRSTTGSYFDSAGVLQSAAINVARNTYNPANLAAQPYLLLEEARTNGIRNNTMVGAVAGTPGTDPTNWFVTGSSLGLTKSIAGVGTANGISYVDIKYVGTASSSGSLDIYFDGITGGPSASNGQSWNSSLYTALVAGSLTGVAIAFRAIQLDGGGTNVGSLSGASITPTSTLTRVSNTYTLNAATVATVQSLIRVSVTSGAAIDITLRIGLPQLEQGAFATSVIPTTTTALTRAADISSSAQATRAADVASVNTLSPWYNASESTLYTEYSSPVPTTVSASAVVAGYDDGTASNRFSNFYTSQAPTSLAANQTTAGVANYTISAASGVTLSNVQKQATRFQAGSYASSANGAAAVTDAFASAPPAVNTLRFGLRPSGTQANIWLRRITVYPRGLSDAELISLTS